MDQSVKFCDRKHFFILKGIAIALIIINHVGNLSGKTWFTPLGGIGVAIFLFCSAYGLTISAQKGGVEKYWFKKLINVYMPYFIIEIIASIFLKRSFKSSVFSIILLRTKHPYGWYMKYIFGCYLIFYLLFILIKNKRIFNMVFLLLGIVSFFVFQNLQAEQAFSFPLGILIANSNYNFENIKKSKFLLFGFSFIFIGVFFLALKQLPQVRELNHYVITLINLILKSSVATGLINLSYLFSRYIGFFNPVGKISYELYLVHGYLIFIIAQNLLGNYFLNTIVFLMIVVFVSLLLHIINSYYQKKIILKNN